MDLPLVGSSFTWSITRDPPIWSRIDRLLVASVWEALFLSVPEKAPSSLFGSLPYSP